MDSIRIINLPSKTYIEEGDYIAIDNQSNGTKKVQFTNLLDDTLSQENKAADAQVTGEAIGELNININNANARINNANARIDNLIIDGEPSVKTLWTGQITLVNRTAILSESVNNFDYLDFYTTHVCRRVPVSAGSVWIDEINISDDGSVNFQQTGEQLLTFSGTTVTLSTAHIWEYIAGNTPTITEEILSFVTRIDGVKNNSVALSQEVSDIRIGDDGVTYQTAGEAVRTQFANVKSEINKIDVSFNQSSLSTGKYYTSSNGEAALSDNASSYYTPEPIDVSGCTKVKIKLSSVNSGGSRAFGFVDENNKWVDYKSESGTASFFELKNGMYEATFDVKSDYFVFSYSTAATKIIIERYKPNFYTWDSAEAKFDELMKYSPEMLLPDFTAGYYYAFDNWALAKSSNSDSIYTPTALDLSAYIGGVLRIEMNRASLSVGNNRQTGFLTSDDVLREVWAEGVLPFVYDSSTGNYIAEFPIKYPKFLFSYVKTDVCSLSIQARRNISVQEDELDAVKRYVGININDRPLDMQLIYFANNTRLFTLTTPLDGIKKMTVDGISGYQSVIFMGDTVPPSSGGNTGWSTTGGASVYNKNDAYKYAYIGFKKPDNSVLTKSDYDTINASLNVHIAENSIQAESHQKTVYVSTSGSDSNDGTTRATPYATIQKAIDSGAKNILVKEGTYTQGFTLNSLDGVNIGLDHYYDSFTVVTDEDNPKVIIDGSNDSLQQGVVISGCTNCNISNIEVKNTTLKGFSITRSSNLRFDDCIAHDIGIGQSGSIGGFVITYTDADFYNCVAYNIGTTTKGTAAYHYDGFNIHDTGTTNFINCKAWNCEDDGISHHDACCGLIDGGEWYNCGKGGVASPTHGAKVNISNVYCHDNQVGIYAENDNAVTDRGNIILSNCVCKNNSYRDMIVGDYYKFIAINCIYDTIIGGSNVTRFGITS